MLKVGQFVKNYHDLNRECLTFKDEFTNATYRSQNGQLLLGGDIVGIGWFDFLHMEIESVEVRSKDDTIMWVRGI